MSTLAPLCRYCGKEIAKQTRRVWIVTKPSAGGSLASHFSRELVLPRDQWPVTKDECAKHTNWIVIGVKRTIDKSAIDTFFEWDGATYVDEYFCSGDHARSFGRIAAATQNIAMRAYNDAVRRRKP